MIEREKKEGERRGNWKGEGIIEKEKRREKEGEWEREKERRREGKKERGREEILPMPTIYQCYQFLNIFTWGLSRFLPIFTETYTKLLKLTKIYHKFA